MKASIQCLALVVFIYHMNIAAQKYSDRTLVSSIGSKKLSDMQQAGSHEISSCRANKGILSKL